MSGAREHPVIAYQGEPGAFSQLAAQSAYPHAEALPCATFEDAFAAVEDGRAALAMIPVENSVAGRVADIHHLLPASRLHIVAEHFQPVRHNVLARPGVRLDDIRQVRSHAMALAQCRSIIAREGWTVMRDVDTAGAARAGAAGGAPGAAALAARLAAEIYGLQTLAADVQDDARNTTRFVVMAQAPAMVEPGAGLHVTSFLFRVRNVPAALYKVMGGFATNGVNMTKLESYQLDGSFNATQFYADVEGHPEEAPLARAFEELKFFSHELRIVGSYRAHPYRIAERG